MIPEKVHVLRQGRKINGTSRLKEVAKLLNREEKPAGKGGYLGLGEPTSISDRDPREGQYYGGHVPLFVVKEEEKEGHCVVVCGWGVWGGLGAGSQPYDSGGGWEVVLYTSRKTSGGHFTRRERLIAVCWWGAEIPFSLDSDD